MPIPKPKKDEKEKDFISRCMKAIGDEYPQKQALAICYQKWNDRNKKKEVKEMNEITLTKDYFIEGEIISKDSIIRVVENTEETKVEENVEVDE